MSRPLAHSSCVGLGPESRRRLHGNPRTPRWTAFRGVRWPSGGHLCSERATAAVAGVYAERAEMLSGSCNAPGETHSGPSPLSITATTVIRQRALRLFAASEQPCRRTLPSRFGGASTRSGWSREPARNRAAWNAEVMVRPQAYRPGMPPTGAAFQGGTQGGSRSFDRVGPGVVHVAAHGDPERASGQVEGAAHAAIRHPRWRDGRHLSNRPLTRVGAGALIASTGPGCRPCSSRPTLRRPGRCRSRAGECSR